MKRFTETDKWTKDPWFRGLSAPAKLVFFYLIENCNNAGFLELDKEFLVILTKMKVQYLDGALKELGRAMLCEDGWIWMINFLKHQKNEDLNPLNPAHKQIITLLYEQEARFSSSEKIQKMIRGINGPSMGRGKVRYSKGTGTGKVKFVKPTREEVRAYAKEIGHSSPDSWYDHFESNGWKVSGRAQMVDWKAALRSSKNRSFGKSSNQEPPAFQVV